MTPLPVLTYSTVGLPEARAFAEWRAVMAPVFHVEPARFHGALPRGSVRSVMVGEVIANRSVFTAQHFARDAALVAATPGHLLLQAYVAGSFHGVLAERTVTVGKGMVAVTDLRRIVDVRAATSSTVGLALPRRLAAEIGADALTPGLDPARNRRLAAWIVAFHRRLPRMGEADVPALTAEIARFLKGLCDGAGAADPPEEDAPALLARAEAGAPGFSPARLAGRLGVSRATLYRLFAPLGGVMRQVQEGRLLAAHAALADALEPRSLAQVAADLGFGSAALFSRNFRERFGLSPRAHREAAIRAADAARPDSLEPVRAWWTRIGE